MKMKTGAKKDKDNKLKFNKIENFSENRYTKYALVYGKYALVGLKPTRNNETTQYTVFKSRDGEDFPESTEENPYYFDCSFIPSYHYRENHEENAICIKKEYDKTNMINYINYMVRRNDIEKTEPTPEDIQQYLGMAKSLLQNLKTIEASGKHMLETTFDVWGYEALTSNETMRWLRGGIGFLLTNIQQPIWQLESTIINAEKPKNI